MAITYVGTGTTVYSTGNPSPGAVSGQQVGDLLILAVGTKPDTTPATTPSGWTLLGAASGGTGNTGIDTGPMRIGIFYKIATSAGETPGAITITGNNVSTATIYAFRAGAGNIFDIAGTGAADTTTGTPHSAVMPVNPGITVGDVLLAIGVIPTDVTTPAQFSAETVSAAGMTTVSLTEIEEWDTQSGQDMGGWVAYGTVATGTATGAPTVSATAGGTTTNVAGPIYLTRLRELPAQANKAGSDTGAISSTETASLVQIVSKTGSDTGAVGSVESASVVASNPPSEITVVDYVYNWSLTEVPAIAYNNFLQVDDLVVVMASTDGDSSALSGVTFSGAIGSQYTFDNNQAGYIGVAGRVTTPEFFTATPTKAVGGAAVGEAGVTVMYVLRGVDHSALGAVHGYSISDFDPLYFGTTVYDSGLEIVFSRNTQPMSSGFISSIGTTVNTFSQQIDIEYAASAYIKDRGAANGSYNVSIIEEQSRYGFITGVEFKPLATAATSEPKTGSDTGAISATETATLSINANVSVNDSGTIGGTEQATLSKNSSLSDTGAITSTESATLVKTSAVADSGTVSSVETASVLVLVNVSDSGAVTGSDASSPFVSSTATDTGAVTGVDTSTSSRTFALADSGTIVGTETASVFNDRAGADTGVISATESASVVVTGTISKTGSDTGAVAGLDTASVLVTITAGDSGTVVGTESTSSASNLTAADTGALTGSETSTSLRSFSLADSGTILSTETATASVTQPVSDSGAVSSVETASLVVTSFNKTANETGTITGTESVTLSTTSTATDTGAVASVETATLFKQIAVSDSSVIASTETANIFNDRAGADAGIITGADQSSLVITGTIDKAGSDTGVITGSESRTLASTSVRSDTGRVTATESTLVRVTSSVSDTGAVGVVETADSSGTGTNADTGVVSATEEVTLVKINAPMGIAVDVWSGTQMVQGGMRMWNGSELVNPVARVWNGTNFVQL